MAPLLLLPPLFFSCRSPGLPKAAGWPLGGKDLPHVISNATSTNCAAQLINMNKITMTDISITNKSCVTVHTIAVKEGRFPFPFLQKGHFVRFLSRYKWQLFSLFAFVCCRFSKSCIFFSSLHEDAFLRDLLRFPPPSNPSPFAKFVKGLSASSTSSPLQFVHIR